MSVSETVAFNPPPLASSLRAQSIHTLPQFGLRNVMIAAKSIRTIGDRANNFEEVAGRIVRYLYTHFTDSTMTQPACALVRLFRTQPFDELDEQRREFARRLLTGASCAGTVKCFCLAASAGQAPEWNDPALSRRYRAIPIRDISFIGQFPMMGQLLTQLGAVRDVLPSLTPTVLIDPHERAYNVFYVPEAAGSPYVPAQEEFVQRYGIHSVVGFGGLLPSGNLFAVILFSKAAIRPEDADCFRALALAAKLALLPFDTTLPSPE